MAELARFESGEVTSIVEALAQHGACIVLDVLPTQVCRRLVQDFEPHLGAMTWGEDELGYRSEFYGAQTKRLHGLFSRSPAMVDVLTLEVFLDVAQRVVVGQGGAKDLRLSNAELMVLASGQGNQMFHTDDASWPPIARQGPEILVSANCALTPFTEHNGATRVVPGSHLWTEPREPSPEEICLAVMPEGAALLYNGRVLHSGGANTTPQQRIGLYLGYVASWLRPLENHLVTNRVDDIHRLSHRAQRLLDVSPGGFTVYA